MKKVCKNCQYFREGYWCSNSKSPFYRFFYGSTWIAENNTCDQFSARDKKAPWWMRTFNKIMKGSK